MSCQYCGAVSYLEPGEDQSLLYTAFGMSASHRSTTLGLRSTLLIGFGVLLTHPPITSQVVGGHGATETVVTVGTFSTKMFHSRI